MQTGSPIRVFVALGSNLGPSRELLSQAMDRLQDLSQEPLLRSSLWQTSPVECPPGSPVFINAIVGLIPQPGETPLSLLGKLQRMERELGRPAKEIRNEPRPLDLDIISWGELMDKRPDLVLPHPRAHLRRFVLAPLAELAPDWKLPGQSRTVRELLADLPDAESAQRLPS